ncbi:MAG TPA: citrate transporter [Candidatus Dormibacteraeota bacterium]|nr:citrate transporter [Candidatus Dormibacteraeota bacterium]
MTALLLLLVFAAFAALMFARVVPALLAVPAMAILVAIVVRLPLGHLLNDVIAAGSIRLAPAYIAVFAGAMMGRVMMHTGIAEEIIKRAAEFGGDRPMIVAAGLMIVTAALFTSLTGLGAIIMVGSLVLPIMMTLGVPRKLSAVLFLMAFATGFIFNIALWRLYREVLQIAPASNLPPAVPKFAAGLLLVTCVAVIIHTLIAFRRARGMSFWTVAAREDLTQRSGGRRVPVISFFTPFVPLVLYVGFHWSELPAFLGGALFGVLTTEPRLGVRRLAASAIRGVEDGAPAVILLIGIGMLLNALTLPAVKASLAPIVTALPLSSPAAYVLSFGLLSPLALYRGPLNPFGVGIGVYSIIFATGTLPASALLAAIMSVVQVQNVCDPTNTHNVWVATFTGVPVAQITRAALLTMMGVCFGGLLLGASMFLR